MFVLGLTGQSGAGKGTVANILEEYGFFHIDTDEISREVVPDALPDLINEFGKDILNEDNSLNRKALAQRAFKNDESIEKLNDIMHKRIMEKVVKIIETVGSYGFEHVTFDGAALFEAGAEKICDKTLLVISPQEVRLNRVLLRDKISREQVLIRFERQKSLDYYKEKSDFIIENNEDDDYESLKKKIYIILNKYLKINIDKRKDNII